MADDSTFDPFELKKAGASSPQKVSNPPRPVLIAVSQGNAIPAITNYNDATMTAMLQHHHQQQQQLQAQDPQQPNDSFDQSLDPFGIAAAVSGKNVSSNNAKTKNLPIESPPLVSRVTRSTPNPIALPPKLVVRLTIYEEVSSIAKVGTDLEGASNVSIEGSVFAQVQCSDALKNAPFSLSCPVPVYGLGVRPNTKYTMIPQDEVPIVTIPKHEIGYVPVMYYSLTDEVQHMPILLERKVTINEKSIRIALQVRSKLTNIGDLEDFTIAVAVPEHVDGQSIKVLRGDGAWDDLKRLIKWKLSSLKKGHSFMVSAQATLWQALPDSEHIHFPIILRCKSSTDQISNVDFDVIEAQNYPSSLSSIKAQSFRLLHRLPSTQ